MLLLIKNQSVKLAEPIIGNTPKKKPVKLRKRLHENDNSDPRPPLPIDETELSLCILIWQSTVIQALYDLTASQSTTEGRILRAEAISWLSGNSADFELVCDLACLSRSRVIGMAKKVIKEGESALAGFNFRTIRKDFSDRIPTRRNKIRGE